MSKYRVRTLAPTPGSAGPSRGERHDRAGGSVFSGAVQVATLADPVLVLEDEIFEGSGGRAILVATDIEIMRMTIETDEQLLAEAMAATGART